MSVATLDINRLKEAMADANIDQSGLARAIGCTPGAINQIVAGNVERSRYLADIASELGVGYDWLIGESDDKRQHGSGRARLRPNEHRLIDSFRRLRMRDSASIERITVALEQQADREAAQSLPSEAALTRMFEGFLAASPRLHGAELARELARLLPIGLGALKGPLSEPSSDQVDEPPAPLAAASADDRAPRRASRT